MMFRFALVAVLVLGQAAALAETKWFHPRHAKPEDVESVVNRLAPKAGIAAVPRQGAVLVNATSEVLDEVSRIIRELDQPNQTVEFEIGITGSTSSSERTLGTGIGIRRAGATNPDAGSPPPTELRQTSGSSSSASRQTVIGMPGSPLEVFIGDTIVRDGGPLSPPLTVDAGKLVKIDSLRVIENGRGAEMEVAVEATTPGAGPIVSSGTRAKTQVRLMVGQTQTVTSIQEETGGDTSSSGGTADRQGLQAGRRRSRLSGSTSGSVTITLKRIR